MSTSSVIFFGNEQLSTGYNSDSAPILERVLSAGYDVQALILNQKSLKDVDQLAVARLAQKNNIPILLPQNSDDLKNVVGDYKADFGVLAAYGRIIPGSVLEVFKKGIINVHPSLLPEYRGPTPIEQALLDGKNTTGVSIIRLGEQMDAGDIYMQQELPIVPDEKKSSLTKRLSLLGAQLLSDHLDAIITGSLLPKKQVESDATYCHLIEKTDGVIDTQKSSLQIEREVRAYAGWPKSTFVYNGIDIIVLEARSSEDRVAQDKLVFEGGKLLLGCHKSTLEIVSLQMPGKKAMDAKSFYNGFYRSLQG